MMSLTLHLWCTLWWMMRGFRKPRSVRRRSVSSKKPWYINGANESKAVSELHSEAVINCCVFHNFRLYLQGNYMIWNISIQINSWYVFRLHYIGVVVECHVQSSSGGSGSQTAGNDSSWSTHWGGVGSWGTELRITQDEVLARQSNSLQWYFFLDMN
jgi:uncharacterized membrane protein YgcG